MPAPIALTLTPINIKTAQPAEAPPIEIPAQDIQRAVANGHYLFVDLIMGLKPLSSQELNHAREDIATSINRYASAYLKATIRAAQAALIEAALDMDQPGLINPNLTHLLDPTSLSYAEVVREVTKTHLSQSISALLPGDEIEYNGYYYAWNPQKGQDNDLEFLRGDEIKGEQAEKLLSLKQLHTTCKDVLFATCVKTANEHYVFKIDQESKGDLKQKITKFKQEEAEARALCDKLRAEQLPLDDRLQTARSKHQEQQRLIQARRQKIIEWAERLFTDKGAYAPLSFLTQLELAGIAPGMENFHEKLANALLHQQPNPLASDLRDHQTLLQISLTASRNTIALTRLSASPEGMSLRQLRETIFIAKERPFQDLPEATIAIMLHEKNLYQVDLTQHPITPLSLSRERQAQLLEAFSELANGTTRPFDPPAELISLFPHQCTLLKTEESPEQLSVSALKALLQEDKPVIAFDGHKFYRINLERPFIQLVTASTAPQQEEHAKLHAYFAAPETGMAVNRGRVATPKEQRLIAPIMDLPRDKILSTLLTRCDEYLFDPTLPKDVDHNSILHTVAQLAATHSNHHSLDPVFKKLSTILNITTRIKDKILKHERAADGLPPLTSEVQNARVKQKIKEALLEENLQGKSPLDLFLKANRSPFLPLLLDYISKNEEGQDINGTSAFQQVVLGHLLQFSKAVTADLEKLRKDSKKSKKLSEIEYQHGQVIAAPAAAAAAAAEEQPPALNNDPVTRAFLRNFHLQALLLTMFKAAKEAYDQPLRDAIIDRAHDSKPYLGWFEFHDPLFHRLVEAAVQFTKKELNGHYERPIRSIRPHPDSTPDTRELAAIKAKLSEVEQEATRAHKLLALKAESHQAEVMAITADFNVSTRETRRLHGQQIDDLHARAEDRERQAQERFEAIQDHAAQERAEAVARDKKIQEEFTAFKKTTAEQIDRLTALVSHLLEEKQQRDPRLQANAPQVEEEPPQFEEDPPHFEEDPARIEDDPRVSPPQQPISRRPSLFLERRFTPLVEAAAAGLAPAANQ